MAPMAASANTVLSSASNTWCLSVSRPLACRGARAPICVAFRPSPCFYYGNSNCLLCMKTKHTLALAGALLASAVALMAQSGSRSDAAALPIARGPFQPTLESLQRYQCPEWFRDAKFGIWAHWGPQAVPMDGDWYARGMYEPGNRHYKYHLEHYGHPSTNGYKDIIPLWKAEKWDPNRLMALYKQAD